MSHKQSKFSKYKNIVNAHLKRLGWPREVARDWLNSHKDIIYDGMHRQIPAFELAGVVNKFMKDQVTDEEPQSAN